ncbi:MAG: hypothetical protein Fur0022_11400 [Anaerolineales bacterium]
MTFPTLLLGSLLGALLGTAFHFFRGGSGWRWLLYVVLSLIGFWIGHFLTVLLGWELGSIGALRVGGASLGSLLFLLVGNWLAQFQTKGR